MPNEPVTFVVFTGDLVTFALKRILQVDWKLPYQTSTHRKTFHETVGEAALVFRDRHSDEFAEMIADFPSFVTEDVESAVDYLEHFVGTHFKGRVPLMELLVYCAFLVDLCVVCAENGRTDLVEDIVSESYDVYADHVEAYFEIVGGWLALLRVARDYLAFVESMRSYSALVATDSENGVAIPSDNKGKHMVHIKSFRDIVVKDVNSTAYTGSEGKGLACTTAANNIVSLGNKDNQAILKTINSDYIRAITDQTSSTDSEDLMSISSTETDDLGTCRTISVSAESMDINDARSTLTANKQDIPSETTSSHLEDLMSVYSSYSEGSSSICCLADKCKCGNSSAGTGSSFRAYSNGTGSTISSSASDTAK